MLGLIALYCPDEKAAVGGQKIDPTNSLQSKLVIVGDKK